VHRERVVRSGGVTADAVSEVWPPLEERAEELVAEAEEPGHPRVQPPEVRDEGAVELPDGRGLGFAQYGDPDGEVVLWFHGTPGARQQVPPDINEEADRRGFRVIGIERPGTGLSTPFSYARIVDWAADIEVVVDRLGIDRFATVGLSSGGPFVLAVCHELGDRVVAGAVLGGVGPTRGPEAAPGITRLLPPFEPLLGALRVPAGELLTHVVRPLCRFGSPAFDLYARIAPASDRTVMKVPEMKAMFLHDIISAAAGGLRAPVSDLVLFSRDWGFSLADIEVPVKFWNGDADGIVPLSHGEVQAGLVPGAELVVCPGGGHFAGFLLAADVLGWIADTWPDRDEVVAGTAP
jgi:pimeloyl-ACP methyl ester carboxylesterase